MTSAEFYANINAKLKAVQDAQAAVDAENPVMQDADNKLQKAHDLWYLAVINPQALVQPLADAYQKAIDARQAEFDKASALQQALQKAEMELTQATNPSNMTHPIGDVF